MGTFCLQYMDAPGKAKSKGQAQVLAMETWSNPPHEEELSAVRVLPQGHFLHSQRAAGGCQGSPWLCLDLLIRKHL